MGGRGSGWRSSHQAAWSSCPVGEAGAGVQAPSSTPNLNDSVIITSFRYSLTRVFFFFSSLFVAPVGFFSPFNSSEGMSY